MVRHALVQSNASTLPKMDVCTNVGGQTRFFEVAYGFADSCQVRMFELCSSCCPLLSETCFALFDHLHMLHSSPVIDPRSLTFPNVASLVSFKMALVIL